jgi:hypothetical protein
MAQAILTSLRFGTMAKTTRPIESLLALSLCMILQLLILQERAVKAHITSMIGLLLTKK